MGYRNIKLDCASVCSDARSRGQPCHCANLPIMLILRDKNSVLILCIIVVAVFFGQGSRCIRTKPGCAYVLLFFSFFFFVIQCQRKALYESYKKKKGEENASCYCCFSLLFCCFCHVCFILWTVWVTARKVLMFRTPTYFYTIYNEHVHANV